MVFLLIAKIYSLFSSGIIYCCTRFLAIWRKVSLLHLLKSYVVVRVLKLFQFFLLTWITYVSFVCASPSCGLSHTVLLDYFSCWDASLLNQKGEERSFMRFVPFLHCSSSGSLKIIYYLLWIFLAYFIYLDDALISRVWLVLYLAVWRKWILWIVVVNRFTHCLTFLTWQLESYRDYILCVLVCLSIRWNLQRHVSCQSGRVFLQLSVVKIGGNIFCVFCHISIAFSVGLHEFYSSGSYTESIHCNPLLVYMHCVYGEEFTNVLWYYHSYGREQNRWD